MGPVSAHNSRIAPAFSATRVDLCGPLTLWIPKDVYIFHCKYLWVFMSRWNFQTPMFIFSHNSVAPPKKLLFSVPWRVYVWRKLSLVFHDMYIHHMGVQVITWEHTMSRGSILISNYAGAQRVAACLLEPH